ncbi:MAG TPA: EamA family transporter [Candidatus Veblenbacteria bacterium]|nr:EamA family transporter [Candidatus Veblenbacteria bacterium]
MNNYRTGPWLVALAAFLWAIDAPFRKYLTADLSSTTIVFMEHILIVIIVLVGLRPYLKEFKKLNWRGWLAIAFIGFGGSALATVLFTQSFHYVNPSVAILLQKIQPLVAIFLAIVFLHERLSKKFWWWALLALVGAYVVSFPEISPQGLSFSGGTIGVFLALAAAGLWGGATVFGRYLLRDLTWQAITALRFISALIFLLVIQVYYGRLAEVGAASGQDWIFVFIVAIVAGFVSLLIYYRGLKYTSASIATLAELTFPMAAVVINWIFLDASLTFMQIIGSVVLLLAITKLSWVNINTAKEA